MAASGIGGRGAPAIPRPLLDRFLRDGDGRHLPTTANAEEYLAAIRRDVETLLNTRSPAEPDPGGAVPARASVTGYGLPDFSHLSPDSPDDLRRLAAMVGETLERFETRLENIRVGVEGGGGFRGGVISVVADTRAGLGRMEFALRSGNFPHRT